MRKTLLIIITVVALVAVGCSTAMVPVGPNRYPPGSMRVEMIVGQDYPHFDRYDPYTPIHVTIRNNTPKKVHLSYSYFTLIDPAGRAYVIAPVRDVVEWVRYERWHRYYGPYYPAPIGQYVFREGRLSPGRDVQAVMFFHQAIRYGQGTYTLRADIPENGRSMEFKFRLK